jgi:hypothetical protein
MARKPTPSAEKPQIEKFRDLARELECDDDEDAFDARLKRIAKALKTPAEKKPSGMGDR